MIDIASEELIPVNEAARLIPGKPAIATVWRWILTGVRGRRLESVLVGGRRFVSREAIQRFCESGYTPGESQSPVRTSRQRQAAIAAATRELDAAGI